MEKYKYPKTFHLPTSPGLQNDDRMLPDLACFEGKMIIITEKMDGENTSMYRDHYHARSLDSNNHPSRNYVKGIWGAKRWVIPKGWRICGENMYAEHSIPYKDLEDYFLVFSIWDENNICLSWEDTKYWCESFGLKTVPELVGPFEFEKLETIINHCHLPQDMEGYVIRNAEKFHYNAFQENVAKWVRKNHVQTDEHWMSKTKTKNELRKTETKSLTETV